MRKLLRIIVLVLAAIGAKSLYDRYAGGLTPIAPEPDEPPHTRSTVHGNGEYPIDLSVNRGPGSEAPGLSD